jgi:hypothetical protein
MLSRVLSAQIDATLVRQPVVTPAALWPAFTSANRDDAAENDGDGGAVAPGDEDFRVPTETHAVRWRFTLRRS